MFWKGYIEVPSHGPCGPGGCGPAMPRGPSANPNGGMTKNDVSMPRRIRFDSGGHANGSHSGYRVTDISGQLSAFRFQYE